MIQCFIYTEGQAENEFITSGLTNADTFACVSCGHIEFFLDKSELDDEIKRHKRTQETFERMARERAEKEKHSAP